MQRLDRFGDEGLQHMALDGQSQAGHGREPAMCCPRLPSRLCRARISPRVVSTPVMRPRFAHEAGHFAVLDDVDAADRSPRAHSPTRQHRGEPCRRASAAARPGSESGRSRNRETAAMRRTPSSVEQLRIDAVHAHGVAASRVRIALRVGMKQIQHAALTDHRVVVEIAARALPTAASTVRRTEYCPGSR